MAFPLLHGQSPVADLYARALSIAMQLQRRIIDPDFSAQKDPEAWDKINRDIVVGGLINQRKNETVGLDWTVQPARGEDDTDVGKKRAELARDAIDEIEDFPDARLCLANAPIRGRSYGYLEGERRWCRLAGILDNWWVPTAITDMDKDRFQLRPGKPELGEPTIVEELWSIYRRKWEPTSERDLIIRVVFRDEERRLGYGRGLMDGVYAAWWLRSQVMTVGLQGLDRWANGIIQGIVKRELATKDKNVQKLAEDFLDVLGKMRSQHVVVTEDGHEIKVHAQGGQGGQLVIDFAKYLDERITIYIMGSSHPFGGGDSGGSLARAQVEQETSRPNIAMDRRKIDAAITKGVIKPFLRLNHVQLVKHGLFAMKAPKFETSLAHHDDPTESMQIAESLQRMEVPILQAELYRKSGFSQPTPDDLAKGRVFKGKAPAPAGGGGFPFLREGDRS